MFYLTRFYKYLMGILCFLPAAYGVLTILNGRRQPSFKNWISGYQPWKGKGIFNFLILVVFLLNCFMVPICMGQNVSAEISLNYAKASQGLNPNGTRFNQSDILSSDVLERAIEKGALKNVTVEDLKSALSVSPLVQGASENESTYFISTQFGLFYNAKKETAHLDGETLTGLVAESYKEWFVRQYSENTKVLQMDFSQIEQKDYLDICKYLKKQAESIGSYMMTMSNEEAAFQSETTGETFQSISAQAYSVANIMAEGVEAYVLEEGVSKETTEYVGRLSFQNVFKYFDAQKAEAASENNLTAIAMYEDDMARIVLVPTYDTNDQFYMSQTRIGIDDFAAAADSYADTKTEIHAQMEQNNHILTMLSNMSIPDGRDEKAETLITQIEAELNRLALEADNLVKEYSTQQANKYMSIKVITLEDQIFTVLVKILEYTLLFAVSMHVCMFAVHINRKSRRRTS